jgi:acetylornithine deacetylase/succinyl-diaminopimelate desuccinylase-like protein
MTNSPAGQGQDRSSLHERPAELLQRLIRFDTTNPPGNEAACIAYADELLTGAGFETRILAKEESRTNLVTRLPGRGQAPPLLLYGHVDVVTTEGQPWTQPPFEGKLLDREVWGRGALDMKGGVAMMLAALLRAKAEGFSPAGDVILALVSDEEAGGGYGAGYLVDHHPGLFEGAKYAIGELGGFSIYIGDRKWYPIMVAEKQMCRTLVTVRGEGGHGSMPVRGQAMAKLAHVLRRLDQQRLPVHITPAAQQMIEAMALLLPFPKKQLLLQVLNPRWTDRVLDLVGSTGRLIDPLLHNTVSPTILKGSDKVNVIPCEASVELDGRLLPGCTDEDLVRELGQLLGDEVELTVVRYEPGPPQPDMGLFETLACIVREADPQGTPGPLLLSGCTDARYFARLGIQTYGFTPMNLPAGLDIYRLAHGPDERVPVEALEFGTAAMYQVLERFGQGN